MDRQRMEDLLSRVTQISVALDTNPGDFSAQLLDIRNIISSLQELDLSDNTIRRALEVPLIQTFQRAAFMDADNGAVSDIANWCLTAALALLQLFPQDVDVLELLGKYWLLRAQPPLARIHQAEGSPSGSSRSNETNLQHNEEAQEMGTVDGDAASRSAEDADIADDRANGADYVEARAILLPATEYLGRAVESARSQQRLTGQLLCTAAEAFMSLGNVAYPRDCDRYYRQALDYLYHARDIPGYSLPQHLQYYLEEYGPLINMAQ